MLVMLSALELLCSSSGVLELVFVLKVMCCVYWGHVFMLLELKPWGDEGTLYDRFKPFVFMLFKERIWAWLRKKFCK